MKKNPLCHSWKCERDRIGGVLSTCWVSTWFPKDLKCKQQDDNMY